MRPSCVGDALVEDIQSRRVPEAAVGIWWLGQASFVIKGAGTVVYVDPYLAPKPHRIVPPPLSPEQVVSADLVLCTHNHGDHIDPAALPGIARASPGAKILVPRVAREKVIGMGVSPDRVIVPAVNTPTTFGAMTVTAIPAAHEELDYTAERGYPYLGYILRVNGVTLYHSGDCVMYEGLIEMVRSYAPDVAMLPINGHDWKRLHNNVVGNMTYREAADLAVAADVDTVIPMHYGMFQRNTERPGHFVDYVHDTYPEQKIHVMARYEGFVYLKG